MRFVKQRRIVSQGMKGGQDLQGPPHEDSGSDGVVFAAQPAAVANDQAKQAKGEGDGRVFGALEGGFNAAVVRVAQASGGWQTEFGLEGQDGHGGQGQQQKQLGRLGGIIQARGLDAIAGLEEFEEFLDLPAQFVEAGDVGALGEGLKGQGSEKGPEERFDVWGWMGFANDDHVDLDGAWGLEIAFVALGLAIETHAAGPDAKVGSKS